MKKFLVGCLIIFASTNVQALEHKEVQEDYSTGHLVYTIENVSYNVGTCGHLSKYVLQNVYDDAVAGEFNWEDMNIRSRRNRVLETECIRLQKEMFRYQYLNRK